MKRKDVILIAVLLFAALLAFIGYNYINRTPGDYVVVTVANEEYSRFPLNENLTEEIVGAAGGVNILEIRDGRAEVISADCPDKVCVKHGSIGYNRESIICLPNRLVITVVSDNDAGLDAIVGR